MFGLPKAFDASFFAGRTLEQVAFSANTIDLAFDHNVSVTILGTFSHKSRSGAADPSATESVPVSQSRLMELIGKKIVSAAALMPGTLTLYFDDGQTLSCLDDSPQYESYVIKQGQAEIVV